MIKNLLLSLAVAAFSGVSSFIGSPKMLESKPISITFGFAPQYDPDSGEYTLDGKNYISDYKNPNVHTVNGLSFTCVVYAEPAGDDSNFEFDFDFPDDGTISHYTLFDVQGTEKSNVHITFGDNNKVVIGCYGGFVEQVFADGFNATFGFDWETATPIEPDTGYFNCYVDGGEPILYEGGDWSGTLIANDGYAFTAKKEDIIRRSWGFASVNLTFSEPVEDATNPNATNPYLFKKVGFEFKGLEYEFYARFYAGDIQYLNSAYADGQNDGYRAGRAKGYEEGKHDGLIAGNSYGVWNWLKQAARTTGEFFNIPLLPGFSVGALLVALAGLVIIWLFIRGFLFK